MKFVLLIIAILFTPPLHAKDYVVGEISDSRIMEEFEKFKRHQDDVNYSEEALAGLKAVTEQFQFKVFFGQWCHDSQREIPRLIQLFNKVDKANFEVSYYALDTQKSDPDGHAKLHNIKRTPTLIVFQDGKELARVLEFPKVDWPSDLYEILTAR